MSCRNREFGFTPNSHSYEESYSDDGGTTWKAAFIARLTREKE